MVKKRNIQVDTLRLCAIAGIAVFHAFLNVDYAVFSAPAAALLGCISLLGAYGNHVFFAISGAFLLPRAAQVATTDNYWRSQYKSVFSRILRLACAVAMYGALACLWNVILPSHAILITLSSFVGGLQFIWLYCIFMLLVPALGFLSARLQKWRMFIIVYTVAVFAVSAYIAFVSPGSSERSLFEWRKLMSGAVYLAAFCAGGLLKEKSINRKSATRMLVLSIGFVVIAEGSFAFLGNFDLMTKFSYKSTSVFSFVLALTSLAWALSCENTRNGKLFCWVGFLAQGTLGYYIVQSLFSCLMQANVGAVYAASGQWLAILYGIAVSLICLLAILSFDAIVGRRIRGFCARFIERSGVIFS